MLPVCARSVLRQSYLVREINNSSRPVSAPRVPIASTNEPGLFSRLWKEVTMPIAKVRGTNMNYRVFGSVGPWVALSPGGRRDISGIELLAGRVADQGYRVVIFDRRNTGASDVVIDGNESEYEIWADDVHDLLKQLGALPAIVGGSSSGCRTALL